MAESNRKVEFEAEFAMPGNTAKEGYFWVHSDSATSGPARAPLTHHARAACRLGAEIVGRPPPLAGAIPRLACAG